MTTADEQRKVDRYVLKARSALYKNPTDTKPLTTHDAFFEASKYNPGAANYWVEKLIEITDTAINLVFEKMPDGYMHEIDIEFAKSMMLENKKIIVDRMNRANDE